MKNNINSFEELNRIADKIETLLERVSFDELSVDKSVLIIRSVKIDNCRSFF